jgi:hypothetical protein
MLMKNVAKNPHLDLRFRLILVGMDKVYEVIRKNREELEKENENERKKITEPKMTIIENTCLLMDFIVNFSFDHIITTVFKRLKTETWYADLKWSLEFTEKYVDLLDNLSTKELEFVKLNLNKILNHEQLPDYPYENNVKDVLPTTQKVKEFKEKTKKEKKKLKKGPSLFDPVKIEL